MPFQTTKFYEFRGERLTLRQISRIMDIDRGTLQRRVNRGIALDTPLRLQLPTKKRRQPGLTGDWQKDVEMIVGWLHRLPDKRRAYPDSIWRTIES